MKVSIWDVDKSPPQGEWINVLWSSFSEDINNNSISIPSLIEKNADTLRSRYLAWIYDLGKLHLHERSIIDHLQLRPGFSYWWMTLLIEKCNYSKSPQITDAIRFFMFTDWVVSSPVSSVKLVSENKSLAKCLGLWCKKFEIPFEWQSLNRSPVYLPLRRRLFSVTPTPIQALVWLFHYLIDRWRLRGIGLNEWQETKGLVTFFSYFFNLEPNAAIMGRYKSPYWGRLSDELQNDSFGTNWLHLFVKDALLPNSATAAKTINSFNMASKGLQNHVTLDTFLSTRVVLKALIDWSVLALNGWRLTRLISSSNQSCLDLWPLFVQDWRQSTLGVTALHNALNLGLLESAMRLLPKQKKGFYLQENQGWEFGLIHAWKSAGHGDLIGIPHSTVRFWDLRYFFDMRMYPRKGNNNLPLPNKIALNGKIATDTYKAGGYPAEDLIQVEALRYLYLDEVRSLSKSRHSTLNCGIRLLVLGDYLLSNTQFQMQLLVRSWRSLPKDISVTVKPHPACPIYCEDYPSIPFTVANASVEELLFQSDVAYASAVTSAAVDAYCVGIPVVTAISATTLNLSPLRGCAGVFFVNTSDELVHALVDINSRPYKLTPTQDFFIIDNKLPRWRRLILDAS